MEELAEYTAHGMQVMMDDLSSAPLLQCLQGASKWMLYNDAVLFLLS